MRLKNADAGSWRHRREIMANPLRTPHVHLACRATIFMPEVANPIKVAATKRLGAEVVQTGRDFDTARVVAEEYADRSRYAIHTLVE